MRYDSMTAELEDILSSMENPVNLCALVNDVRSKSEKSNEEVIRWKLRGIGFDVLSHFKKGKPIKNLHRDVIRTPKITFHLREKVVITIKR